MSLTMKATVLQNRPTPGGLWHRLVLAGTGRVNDLVMVPAASPFSKVETGEVIEVEVRASVDMTADHRPTRNIVYFLADDGPTV